MTAKITITTDPAHRLMRMTLGGFFQIADVQKLDHERRLAFRQLGCAMNEHLTLCDVSQCALSTPEVVAELQKVIGNPIYRSKRCAMVVPGMLARLQARRAVQRDDVAMFSTLAEAERWLLNMPLADINRANDEAQASAALASAASTAR